MVDDFSTWWILLKSSSIIIECRWPETRTSWFMLSCRQHRGSKRSVNGQHWIQYNRNHDRFRQRLQPEAECWFYCHILEVECSALHFDCIQYHFNKFTCRILALQTCNDCKFEQSFVGYSVLSDQKNRGSPRPIHINTGLLGRELVKISADKQIIYNFM